MAGRHRQNIPTGYRYEISERLRLTRQQSSLSQEEFAKKLNCNVSKIKSLETGYFYPTLEFIIQWHKTFKVSYQWIIEGANL